MRIAWIVSLVLFSLPNTVFSQWVTNGNAFSSGTDCYQLTSALNSQNGSIFSASTIDLANSFIVESGLYFGNNDGGADGIVFVLTTSNTPTGVGGGGIGYQGISPSFAVEFDTWTNGDLGDPASDHAGIVHSGVNNHNTNGLGPVVSLSNLEDGQFHCFTMVWDADNQEISAYIDGSLAISWSGDPSSYTGTNIVYYGFTASTGGANNVHEVCVTVPVLEPMEDVTICEGESVNLNADPNGVSYDWADPNGDLSNTSIANPAADPNETTNFQVTITYSCNLEIEDDVLVTVLPKPAIIIDLPPSFCTDDPAYTIDVMPLGGSWLGDVDASGSFDPAILGAGEYKAIYTYLDPSTDCVHEECVSFSIYDVPTPFFDFWGPYCAYDTLGLFVAIPGGGTYSFEGMSNNTGVFDPSVFDPGIYQVEYTMTNINGCETIIDQSFEILAVPEISIEEVTAFCFADTIINLNAEPADGLWSGAANSAGEISISQLGAGDHIVFYTSNETPQCPVIDTLLVTIYETPYVELDGNYNLCTGEYITLPGGYACGDSCWVELLLDGVVIDTLLFESIDGYVIEDEGLYSYGEVWSNSPCLGIATGELSISIVDNPVFDNIELICDEENENYQVLFTVSGGDLASYNLTGSNYNSLADGSFSSEFISNNDFYEFVVFDANGCANDTIAGKYSCSCEDVLPTSLIPNPSFENISCCPTSESDLDCADDWIQASDATTDFYHTCGLMNNWWLGYQTPVPFPNGEGVIGFRDGKPGQPNFKEYTGACLTGPMKVGTEYTLDFYVGFHDHWASRDLKIALFATTDCNNLPFGSGNSNFGCPTNGPGWIELDEKDYSGNDEWINANFSFTADQAYTAIVIGPSCEENPNYLRDPYYYLDNLILGESTDFGIPIIALDGNICDGMITLQSEDLVQGTYQWYKDGELLSGETSLDINIMNSSHVEGIYSIIVTTIDNCYLSQEYELIIPTYESFESLTICQGEQYLFGDNYVSESGNYQYPYYASDGCDSIAHLNLIVLANSESYIDTSICVADQIIINDEVFSELGDFSQTLTNSLGCDSTINISIQHIEVLEGIVNAEICEGDVYVLNTESYDSQGSFQQSLLTADGCDSILNLNLTVHQSTEFMLFDTICSGDLYMLNDSMYTNAGDYAQQLLNSENCDSTLWLNLHVIQASTETIVQTICEGDTAFVNGIAYTEEGTYQQMLPSLVVCDSLLNIELVINEIKSEEIFLTKCPSDIIEVNGIPYFDEGVYEQTLSATNLCDSLLSINIEHRELDTVNISNFSCNPLDTGVVALVELDQFGCDSLIITKTQLHDPIECQLLVTIEPNIIPCNLSADTIWLMIEGGAAPYEYVLESLTNSEISQGFLSQSNDRWFISNLSEGDYLLDIFSSDGYFAMVSFAMELAAPPMVTLAVNSSVSCFGESDGSAQITDFLGGLEPYHIEWSTGSNNLELDSLSAGSYSLTITDANECVDIYNFEVGSPEALILNAEFNDPLCFGESNGSVMLNASGGVPSYFFSLDGVQQTNNRFENLAAGNYTFYLLDDNACQDSVSVNLNDPDPLFLDLGNDTTINYGESYLIEGNTSFDPADISELIWANIDTDYCEDCIYQEVSPKQDQTYILNIITENGCIVSDTINLYVVLTKDIYIPNVFSPNVDSANNGFTLDGNSATENINFLYIYDRWGNLLFTGFNLEPGNIQEGWDGKFNNQLVEQGVYTFVAEVRFVDGSLQKVAGDVTLIR